MVILQQFWNRLTPNIDRLRTPRNTTVLYTQSTAYTNSDTLLDLGSRALHIQKNTLDHEPPRKTPTPTPELKNIIKTKLTPIGDKAEILSTAKIQLTLFIVTISEHHPTDVRTRSPRNTAPKRGSSAGRPSRTTAPPNTSVSSTNGSNRKTSGDLK